MSYPNKDLVGYRQAHQDFGEYRHAHLDEAG